MSDHLTNYDNWLTEPDQPRDPVNDDEPDLEYVKSDMVGGTAGRPALWTSSCKPYLNGNADPVYAAELEQRLESLAEGIRDAEEAGIESQRALRALRVQSGKLLEFAIWLRAKP